MSTPTLWYYHKEDRGFGPVEEGDIAGLFARNEVAADTLVWRGAQQLDRGSKH
jgi:hypothetical protein